MAITRAFHVDFLVAIFAIGSWVCIQGLWVELPLIVPALTEGWALPSMLSFTITFANIGPITFSASNHLFPKIATEKRGIYLTSIVGCVSTLMLSLYWRSTAYIWGQERSVALFVFTFFLGLVDCSSRVLYVPFMSKFKEVYLVSYFVGEGLSGFLPSIFALVQGIGGSPTCVPVFSSENISLIEKYDLVYPPPLFSVETFFYFLLGMFIASGVAFHLLNYESIVHKALLTAGDEKSNGESRYPDQISATTSSNFYFYYFCILQLVVCLVSNGILPSIQTFSCLPYGDSVFHLSVTLSAMANPLVCIILLFPIQFLDPSVKTVNISMIIAALISIYLSFTALMSPTPPLVGTMIGEIITVTVWVLSLALFTYIKVSNATMLKRSHGKRGLFWFGATTQIGSATGAVGIFFLVNYVNVFKSISICGEDEK